MKLILSLIITISFLSVINAQTVKWGEQNLSINAKYEPGVLSWNDDGVFCFGSEGTDLYFEKLDPKTFKSVYRTLFAPPVYEKYTSTVEEVAFANGNFIAICSYFNKTAKTCVVYAVEISGETGKATGKEKKIYEAEVERKKEKGNYLVLVTEDNSKILVNHYAYNKKDKRMNDIYQLLNTDLEVVAKRTELFDLDDINYKTSNFTIDNQGSIYFWKTTKDKVSIVSFDANRDFDKWEEVIKFDSKPNSYPVGGSYSFNQDGDLIVAGVWATKSSKKVTVTVNTINNSFDIKYKGTYFLKINQATKEITESNISEFSKNDLSEIMTPRKRAKGAFTSYSVITKEDGGLILVGEKYLSYSVQSRNATTVYHYLNDLLVTNIDAKGEVKWSKVVPKLQGHAFTWNIITLLSYSAKRAYLGIEYFSYVPYLKDDNFYIFFNDNPKNLTLANLTDKQKYLKQNANGSVPVMYKFNLADGSNKKELYKEISAQDVYLKPGYTYLHPTTRELLIFGQKDKKYMFGILK